MKFIIAFTALVAVALAAPQNPQDVQVLRYDNDVRPDGYQFGYVMNFYNFLKYCY